MSCTLKNRPKSTSGKVAPFPITYDSYEVSHWFEEFEKRQRQNLADYEKVIKDKRYQGKDFAEFRACWSAISKYIQLEVLGK